MTCVSGPYFEFSCPFGTWTALERDVWYVSRSATEAEMAESMVARVLKERCLGKITRFRSNMDRFLVDEWNAPEFASLEDAVAYLTEKDKR